MQEIMQLRNALALPRRVPIKSPLVVYTVALFTTFAVTQISLVRTAD
jgi:hypothetical protein